MLSFKVLASIHIKKLKEENGISIYIVDGDYVRTNIDDQFIDFGQHFHNKYIPINEFWIDEGANKKEIPIFIKHLFIEYNLMKKGMSYDKAIDAADKEEKELRKKLKNTKDLKIKILYKFKDGTIIYLVNGKDVRDLYDIDYTEGGHWKVYKWIPKNEIWIDNQIRQEEIPFILIHEYTELQMMKKGMSYDKAHSHASSVESRFRHEPFEKSLEYIEKLKK